MLLLGHAAARGQPASAGDGVASEAVRRGRTLVFPRDHGAHPAQRIEWWYVTGWLMPPGSAAPGPTQGFQITFFRVRTRLGEGMKSRFAPRQMLLAHAAITDLRAQRHVHAQRLARWSGDAAVEARDYARLDDAGVHVGGWRFDRRDDAGASTWVASIDAGDWSLDARMRATQPLLLHGDAGYFVKALVDGRETASHYVTDPQLAVRMRLRLQGRDSELEGRGWLDHEWAETLVPEGAAGWDWIGMNLDDGAALMAYRMRRADGSVLGANGSFRDARGSLHAFASGAVRFTPGRVWQSPATGGRYPVTWTIDTPVGSFEVRGLLDAQELDARASTGTVYWEGLSSLHDAQGRRVGRGYLEMTGYVGRLRF